MTLKCYVEGMNPLVSVLIERKYLSNKLVIVYVVNVGGAVYMRAGNTQLMIERTGNDNSHFPTFSYN